MTPKSTRLLLCLAFGLAVGLVLLKASHAQSLCVNGHPVPRSPHVTYGGLPRRQGYERDHIIPLCLGGPDKASNLQYQPWPEAYAKDGRERSACEAYCRGEITLDEARSQFHREYR